MTLKTVAVIASLGAAALAVSASETFARGRGGPAAVPFAHPGVPVGAHPFVHNHRRGFSFWPGGGFYYGGAPYGEPMAAQPALPTDINYTYTYKQDVPWDWAHRFPPAVAPSDRPYVSNCSSEPVTVPGRGGDQTVNVIRCY